MDTPNKTIKNCFIFATSCIVWLTVLCSIILILNQCSENKAIELINHSYLKYCTDSIEPCQDAKVYIDSLSPSINCVTENRLSNPEINITKSSDYLDSIAAHLTLVVNSVNNILSSGSILIAILTLFIGLVGVFAYHNLKTDVEKVLNQAEHRINTTNESIQSFQDDINNRIKLFESFKTLMTNQANYSNKSIDFLFFNALSTIIEKTEDKDLRDRLFHDFSIITLYRNDLCINERESAKLLHRKKEALEYLSDNVRLEDSNDLEIIVQNESDEYIKRRLIEIITIIKPKDDNSNTNNS